MTTVAIIPVTVSGFKANKNWFYVGFCDVEKLVNQAATYNTQELLKFIASGKRYPTQEHAVIVGERLLKKIKSKNVQGPTVLPAVAI